MPLPYCPNCRHDLPEVIESWICLHSRETGQNVDGSADDLGGFQFTDDGSGDDSPFQSEDEICGKFNPGGDSCNTCGKPKRKGTAEVVCPKCSMELPNVGETECRTMTVTGPSGAGKSHYIIALHTWWSQHLKDFELVAVPAMGSRLKKAFKQFQNHVLRNKKKLNATEGGKMISFSWNIKSKDGARPGILVTLPDVSGERLLTSRYLIANRHYHHAAGVIFLVDADRIIFSDNSGDDVGSTKRGDPADHFEVAEAMISDFERRLAPEVIRNTPIAICVNKLDKLRSYDARWEEIARNYTPTHDGYFDIQTCHARSEHIREVLFDDPDLSNALGLLEASFDNVMYFVMATIGSESETLKLMPVAVEDPFLYQLWHLNYVHANAA